MEYFETMRQNNILKYSNLIISIEISNVQTFIWQTTSIVFIVSQVLSIIANITYLSFL